MESKADKFKMARKAADMSYESAASICGFTVPTLSEREENYRSWRLGELENLYQSMSETPRKLLLEAINDIFLSETLR